MNLHEIYKTLMRRGMPKHRDLVWTAFAEPCVACALDGDVAILTTNTAHDLIAMHAARWAVATLLSDFMKDGYEMSAADLTRWHREISAGLLGENEFAAILAATEYLEPKGADDANKS